MRPLALLSVALTLLGSSQSQGGGLSAVEIKSARKLYLAKCTKCHELHDPDNYTSAEWDEWMGKMARKSKLKPEQIELLARYIAAGKSGEIELPKR